MNNNDICRGIDRLVREHLPQILALRSTGVLKEDKSFVSKGDILCEQLITDYLRQNLPGCHIVSEESKESWTIPEEVEYVVTIDPIDGTENFVSGLKEWGLGVSIYRNGKHLQSMISLPELGICLVTGDTLERIPSSRICGLPSYMTPHDFEALGTGYEFRIMGCCMYNMYNTIRGSYARFQHLKGCYSWDILPGMNLALEHGLHPVIERREYKGEFLLPGIKYRFEVS